MFLRRYIIINSVNLPLNHRHASLALDINPSGLSTDYVVLKDEDLVLRAHVDHDRSTLMMSEGAPCDVAVTLEQQDARSVGVVGCVTLEIGALNVDAVALEDCDRGDLAMDLLKDAAIAEVRSSEEGLTRVRGCSHSS